MQRKLRPRIFEFVVNILKLSRNFSNSVEYNVIKYQLIRSATSSGANYEESQGAGSRADFSHKVRIALKEMRETNYWLRLLKEISSEKALDFEALISESEELKNILGAIASKSRK